MKIYFTYCYYRLKFRTRETPLLKPERAKVSPFPEGRDLG